MRWEALTAKAKKDGKPVPTFGEVKRPVLFDEFQDLTAVPQRKNTNI